ncbi:hypothetical protein ACFVH6_13055 [Spirillospora sp. NPDC127200]
MLVRGWRLAVGVVAVVVAVDHGGALRALGVSRRRFVAEVVAEARAVGVGEAL